MNLLYRIESRFRRYVPRRIFSVCWQDIYVWGGQPQRLTTPPGLLIERAQETDLDALESIEGRHIVKARWEQGGVCWLAREESQVVGIVWGQAKHYLDLELGIEFHLDQGQAWWYAAWVHPRKRNLGIFRLLMNHARLDFLESEGVDQGLFTIDKSNRVSRDVQTRLGAHRVGSLRGMAVIGLGFFTVRMGDQVMRLNPRKKMSFDLNRITDHFF